MNKNFLLLTLLLALFCVLKTNGQETVYSREQIKEDIQFLQVNLLDKQPNLYVYSSKALIDSFFDSLYNHLPASMTELETYQYITPICAKIKDGHTLLFPSEATLAFHNTHSLYFPFKMYWNGEKMYVELNYATDDELPPGAEILNINGVPVKTVMADCLNRMMRDGHNRSYPVWVLNNWFNEYYSYFYGHPTEFSIDYQLNGGLQQTKTVKALSKANIFANRKDRYPKATFSRDFNPLPGTGITLHIDSSLSLAVLTIKTFDKAVLKNTYGQSFKSTIKPYFEKINTANVNNLVLDLRNNQGGDIRNGQYLLQYLMNKPFQLVSGYYKVRNPQAATEAQRNTRCGGNSMGTFQPLDQAFQGQLFVLINGGSFSNSAIVSSALKFYGRGIFIGEESGGNKNVIDGYEKNMVLPHTKIRIALPTRQFDLRERDKNTGQGILPDVAIQPTIDDLIAGKDRAMEQVIRMINK